MHPKLKPNIKISSWEEKCIFLNPENNAQLLLNETDTALAKQLDGSKSFDDLERESQQLGSLHFYQLLRKLWHRGFLYNSEEIGSHFFPSEQPFLQIKKKQVL